MVHHSLDIGTVYRPQAGYFLLEFIQYLANLFRAIHRIN